jgi:hypothetical protein
MSSGANLQRRELVERYTQTTLELLNRPAVEDRLGDRQPELVALLETAFTAARHLGRLVMPPEQMAQNNVAIHPLLKQDRTIPNPSRLIDMPTDVVRQQTAPDSLWSRASDAAIGLYPRFLDSGKTAYAATRHSEASHRDLVTVYPKLERVSPIHAAAIIAHEIDHVRTSRELDQEGSCLSYQDARRVAGEKAAYKVSEAILEADSSLAVQVRFEVFREAIKDASTPAIAAAQADQLTRQFAHMYQDGHLGELAATVYAAKALSLRFGEKGSPPTSAEIEAYKLYGIV